MKPSRATRVFAAVIAVISLLFTQIALASYVCPGTAIPGSVTMMEAGQNMAGMDHCSGMDKAQPTLCHEHNHGGQQSLDKPDLPKVPPFHAVGPMLTVVVPGIAAPTPHVLTIRRFLAHATAPPVAIRHCCFRI
jgi:hypothetical protein